MRSEEDIKLCVKRGVFLLDKYVPAWREKVVIEQLTMSSPCKCVLGFVYGDGTAPTYEDTGYARGIDALHQETWNSTEDGSWAVYHGFDAKGADPSCTFVQRANHMSREYTALREEWIRVINDVS